MTSLLILGPVELKKIKEIHSLAALKERKGMVLASYEKQFFLQNIIKKKIAHIGATNQNII